MIGLMTRSANHSMTRRVSLDLSSNDWCVITLNKKKGKCCDQGAAGPKCPVFGGRLSKMLKYSRATQDFVKHWEGDTGKLKNTVGPQNGCRPSTKIPVSSRPTIATINFRSPPISIINTVPSTPRPQTKMRHFPKSTAQVLRHFITIVVDKTSAVVVFCVGTLIQDIKKSFRRLALMVHPDRAGPTEKRSNHRCMALLSAP